MNTAVVGAARVQFGADHREFDEAAREVQFALGSLVEKFGEVEKRIKAVGAGMSLGITLPFAAMVRAVDKGAGSFEREMKRVEAALVGVSGDELQALKEQARTLGPEVGKSATEAASGIEMLARNGLDTATIMGGALASSLKLAAAGSAELAPAADLVTDVMVQFKKTAADLPGVVQNVVGSMDASKFGFADFQLALAQGGGIAAAAGVSFLDFATAVSATSAQFSSGSDAGTSFKTYIQSLVGKSDEAKRAMKTLGIEFFDTTGRMKPLAEQAEILQNALGGLVDADRTEALQTIFGADAARTAIGLMEQGRERFEELQAAVAGGDVEARIAKQLEGSVAAGERISVAWESVKISLGDTGILAAMTAIKNAFAGMLQAFANAPQVFHIIALAFGGLAAVVGPLLMILGTVGTVIAAQFIRGFGLIGTAISMIIAPVTTVISLIGEAGLMRAFGMAGRALLGLTGPIGWAVGAFILFKDSIIPVLEQVFDKLVSTLGPPLTAIVEKVQSIFARLSGGPIGAAISGLITLLSGVADVIGTVLALAVAILGEALVRTLDGAVAVLGGFVDVISGVVDVVGALLTGDFAGAWDAALGIVDSVINAIIGVISAFVPEAELALRLVYLAAKAWLGDGFASIADWFTSTVQGAVDYVASAFPNVVAAAKGVYDGVKTWLVDKFGWILTWVKGAAKTIGDQYSDLKERLGLGAAAPAKDIQAPVPPKAITPPPAPSPRVNFAKPQSDAGGRAGAKAKERDAADDARNREQMRIQTELEAARTRGDLQQARALQDKLDLERQIEAYQRTGLSLDQARLAASRDMNDLHAARADAMAKGIADEQEQVALDIAQLDGNRQLEDSLRRQEELKRRIAYYYRQTADLAEATRLAEADQRATDDARARVRQRWFDDDAQDRAVRLAQMRGETEEEVRQLQRVIDIRQRARELEDRGTSASDALGQATSEWDEEDQARLTGLFRSTFKDGVRAALDGDLMGWVKNWWKDRVAKGMEEALNSLADVISALFKRTGDGASGGGFLGAIGNVLGTIFGGKSPAEKAPGFKTGGSFRVGGPSGIDNAMVSFRATKGELVDIQRPGNDNGPEGVSIYMPMTFSGAMDLATRTEAMRFAEAARQAAIQGVMEANRRRG